MKKNIAILCCLALIAALLAGCSSKSTATQDPSTQKAPAGFHKTGFPIVDKPITITMFADRSPANGPYKDMSMFQAYEKMTNIKVKFDDVPQASFDEKKSLELASKNLPDVFYKAKITPLEAVKYGSNGTLVPLEGLIKKYAPNIQKIFDQYPEVKQSITAPDGHIYAMSNVVTLLSARTVKLWLNKDMITGVNMEVPTTTDDLYTVLKAFKAKYPNNTPLETRTVGELVNVFSGAWGLDHQLGYNVNIENNKVHIWSGDDKYKEELMYLHKLYKDNLIDHQIVTQTAAQYVAKMRSGKVGLFTNQATDAFPKLANKYEGIAPFKGPEGDQQYLAQPITRDFGAFAITATNKNPEASIRWLDYFFSDKGSIFFRYGVEGKTFHYNANGVPVYNANVLKDPKGIGSMTPWPGGGTPQWVNDKDATAINTPETAAASKQLEPYVPKKVYPDPIFDANTANQVNDIRTDLDAYVNQSTAKFITGDLSFDNWDKYVAQLKKIGIDKLEKFYQDAYNKQYK